MKINRLILPLIILVCASFIHAQKFENLAKTPPMGWNSWNEFGCNVNEDLIKETADKIVSSGMKDAGYEYVVIDDFWRVFLIPHGYFSIHYSL